MVRKGAGDVVVGVMGMPLAAGTLDAVCIAVVVGVVVAGAAVADADADAVVAVAAGVVLVAQDGPPMEFYRLVCRLVLV
jgi:hypothetical protein